MGSIAKKITIFLFLALLTVGITGCSSHTFVKGESLFVSEKDLSGYVNQENTVIVDTRSPEEYAAGHIAGAVNIPTEDIVINVPVKNMLTSKKKIEKVMGTNGISNDTLVLAYDSNKMSASRLLWTLFMYGHQKVKIVDGGFGAIQSAGTALTTDVPTPEAVTFVAGEPSSNWLAKMDEVRNQVEQPNKQVVLLDVRSMEEYAASGKVPTSVMMPYEENFYSDGTFKTVQTTRINYLEQKIFPEDEIIIYCQTSMRAAPVFAQLYEAGYRNIRIYDGAFLEWSSNGDNPIETSPGGAAPIKKDAS